MPLVFNPSLALIRNLTLLTKKLAPADAKERGSGFTFSPPQPNAMLQAVDHAVHVFRGDRAAWQIIQKNGMEQARPCACPRLWP